MGMIMGSIVRVCRFGMPMRMKVGWVIRMLVNMKMNLVFSHPSEHVDSQPNQHHTHHEFQTLRKSFGNDPSQNHIKTSELKINNVNVCPNPQIMSCLTVWAIDPLRVAKEATAAAWSASQACRIPIKNPNPRILSIIILCDPELTGVAESIGTILPHSHQKLAGLNTRSYHAY